MRQLPTSSVAPWRLAAALCALKLLALAIDPQARLFMDDSANYLHSALSGWVPPDRSYSYALLIRISAVAAHSLFALLLVQSALGVGVALVLYNLLVRIFGLRSSLAAAVALLFAVGPEQLFFERMIMAESAGTMALALTLACALLYVRRGHWSWLLASALCGVFAVSLRMNLLPVVLGLAVLPPLARALDRDSTPLRVRCRRAGLHLAIALSATALCHSAYQHWYAARYGLDHADYFAHAGYFRLGLVAPLVKPEHLRGLGLPQDLLTHDAFALSDRLQREAQIWERNGLDDLLRQATDDQRGNALADTIAKRALRDDPFGLLRLGWSTVGDYFDPVQVQARLEDDLGWRRPPGPQALASLRAHFGDFDGIVSAAPSPSADYFAAGAPWLVACLIMLGPLGFANIALHWRDRRGAGGVLGLTSLGLVAGNVLFAHIISFRYLHAFPFLVFLNIGAMLALRRARVTAKRVAIAAIHSSASSTSGGATPACALCEPRYTQ